MKVNSIMAELYSQVAARDLYDAALSGLGYSVSFGMRGIGLSFYGYAPKLDVLATKV